MTQPVFEQRWDRARKEMQQRGLDALLVGDKYNYWYFTGHLSREFDKKMRPMLFLLTRSASPALIVYGQAEAALKRTCPGTILHTYEDVPFPPELLIQALADMELHSSRIGMEFGENERLGLSYNHFLQVREALPDCQFQDAGELLRQLRLIKAPEEIELIRQACQISLQGWKKTLSQLRPGLTNPEIARILSAELCSAGSDFDVAGHVTVGNGVAGETGYQPGQVLWCDFGATFNGYQADLSRRAVFDPVSDPQLEMHRCISSILRAQIEAIGPGKRASDCARVVSDQLRSHGYPPLGPKKRVGHGLGLSPGEPPSLSLADDTILQPGMILTPEPRFFLDSGERVHLEEVVVVTEEGCEQLTEGAETLEIIS